MYYIVARGGRLPEVERSGSVPLLANTKTALAGVISMSQVDAKTAPTVTHVLPSVN